MSRIMGIINGIHERLDVLEETERLRVAEILTTSQPMQTDSDSLREQLAASENRVAEAEGLLKKVSKWQIFNTANQANELEEVCAFLANEPPASTAPDDFAIPTFAKPEPLQGDNQEWERPCSSTDEPIITNVKIHNHILTDEEMDKVYADDKQAPVPIPPFSPGTMMFWVTCAIPGHMHIAIRHDEKGILTIFTDGSPEYTFDTRSKGKQTDIVNDLNSRLVDDDEGRVLMCERCNDGELIVEQIKVIDQHVLEIHALKKKLSSSDTKPIVTNVKPFDHVLTDQMVDAKLSQLTTVAVGLPADLYDDSKELADYQELRKDFLDFISINYQSNEPPDDLDTRSNDLDSRSDNSDNKVSNSDLLEEFKVLSRQYAYDTSINSSMGYSQESWEALIDFGKKHLSVDDDWRDAVNDPPDTDRTVKIKSTGRCLDSERGLWRSNMIPVEWRPITDKE